MIRRWFCARCGQQREVPRQGDVGLCCTAHLEGAPLDLSDRGNPPMEAPPLLRFLRWLTGAA